MKTTLITLAIVATALIGFTPQAEAGTKKDILRFVGHQLSKNNGYGNGHGHCTPYVVRTSEICRRCETRTGYRPCGSVYYYNVTVVTYRDYYSNGSSRTYTRTIA
ncbi:MAG: hypothetical protein P1U58_16315 [Verrucomicrobiales bacterium]|nr:hypothetical protein [Verrucomicrobiales bacterium]